VRDIIEDGDAGEEKNMGMFRKKVKVSNSKSPDRFFEEEFWVDTGALYSFVPEDFLERIGVEPSGKRNLILADGRQDTRLLGFCDFQVEGLDGSIPCPVIFAPKGSLFLLGATALENFGVDADPVRKTLKPILAIIGGFLASR
jgi:predicted aspartyl protease